MESSLSVSLPALPPSFLLRNKKIIIYTLLCTTLIVLAGVYWKTHLGPFLTEYPLVWKIGAGAIGLVAFLLGYLYLKKPYFNDLEVLTEHYAARWAQGSGEEVSVEDLESLCVRKRKRTIALCVMIPLALSLITLIAICGKSDIGPYLREHSLVWKIGAGAIGSIALTVVLLLGCFYWKRSRKRESQKNLLITSEEIAAVTGGAHVPTHQVLSAAIRTKDDLTTWSG